MSDSIDAISGSSAVRLHKNFSNQDAIKPETKQKLDALGIDASQIKTEKEAQKKIKEVESAQANAQVQQGQFHHPMGEVVQDAKKIAEAIGIRVGNVEDVEKLLKEIDKQLKEFEKQVKDDKDDDRKKMVAGVRGVYEQVYAEYQQAISEQKKITGNLDMLATYNKIRS